jgi:hypothetical protein
MPAAIPSIIPTNTGAPPVRPPDDAPEVQIAPRGGRMLAETGCPRVTALRRKTGGLRA